MDRLLDMTRTAVNVCGDAIVTCITAQAEGELDRTVFNDAGAGSDLEALPEPASAA